MKSRMGHTAFLLFCCLTPFLCRLYLLKLPFALNFDEAEYTDAARHLLRDPVVWRSSDLSTSGPLNGLIVTWPYLVGAIPSLFTTRLTGLLLQSATLLGLAGILRRRSPIGPGHAAVLVGVVIISLTAGYDFLQYASEYLSVALITLVCVVLARIPATGGRAIDYAACGLAAGCLPFAKLQSSLFFLLLAAICVSRLSYDMWRGRAPVRHFLAFAGAGMIPVMVLVIPLFFVGEQQAFLIGYLRSGSDYIGTRNWRVLAPILPMTIVHGLLLLAVLGRGTARFVLRTERWDLLVLAVGIWPVTLLTIWFPGRDYPHYQLYAVFCLPLAVVLAQRALPALEITPPKGRQMIPTAIAACLSVFMLGSLYPGWTHALSVAAIERHFALDYAGGRARRLFAWTGATTSDALLLWGWNTEFAAYAGLRPGGRSAQADYLIRPNPERNYFRSRLLRDLDHSWPALILDTARPDYFIPKFQLHDLRGSDLPNFPALYSEIQHRYKRLPTPPDCAGIYVRNDLIFGPIANEIVLQSSDPGLIDGSVTEHCLDWWSPKDPTLNVVDLSPREPEDLRELWILTSRGGEARDRGTTRVRVSFIATDGTTITQDETLFDYPLWTVIYFEGKQPIAHIKIKSLAYVGAGPALNEVKAFRTGSKFE